MMQLTSEQFQEIGDPTFSERVQQVSEAGLERCYQCLTCTLSCPVAVDMDYPPHQIMRMVQLGLKEQVLSSSSIWLCATCETCVARCPQEVDILRVMDTLREMALQEKVKGKETIIPIFHETFLESIRTFGRQHELSMMLLLKLRSRDIFSDLNLGIKMLLKRKFGLLPPRIKGAKEMKAIFEKTKEVSP